MLVHAGSRSNVCGCVSLLRVGVRIVVSLTPPRRGDACPRRGPSRDGARRHATTAFLASRPSTSANRSVSSGGLVPGTRDALGPVPAVLRMHRRASHGHGPRLRPRRTPARRAVVIGPPNPNHAQRRGAGWGPVFDRPRLPAAGSWAARALGAQRRLPELTLDRVRPAPPPGTPHCLCDLGPIVREPEAVRGAGPQPRLGQLVAIYDRRSLANGTLETTSDGNRGQGLGDLPTKSTPTHRS
jgi:hypothetical protein